MNKRFLVIIMILSVLSASAFNEKKEKKETKSKNQTEGAVYASDYPTYVIYNAKGEKVSYAQMIQGLLPHDICLFGELHNDFIAHWLEKTVTEQIVAAKGDSLIMGGEMWEADQQLLMDEFMAGKFVDKKVYLESAKNWPNFEDYKPLLGIALSNKIPFVCSNIPRRYARVLYTMGEEYLDSLDKRAYQYLPPLPIHYDLEQPGYKKMGSIFRPDGEDSSKSHAGPMSGYKGTNLVKAQAIKDATMAYNILKYWKKGKYFIHYNGVYHSQNYEGINYYLKHYNPEIDIVTISVARQKNVMELEAENNTANYNIIVIDNIPTTY